MSTPSKAGNAPATTIQDASAHLFVPYSHGTNRRSTADDSRRPGAYFRLGGYSVIETQALAADSTQGNADNLANFYPRQHLTDVGTNAVEHAAGAGSSYKGGIMLSCDGRMLMRAGERLYVHAKSNMHVDTEGSLTIVAAGAIDMSSDSTISIATRNAKAILISADGGNGSVTTEAKKDTRMISGDSYELILKDKFTYTQANTTAYKLGRSDSVTLGGTLSLFMGASLTVKVSWDLSISFGKNIALYEFKMDAGVTKLDFCALKLELKEGHLAATTWDAKTENIAAVSSGARASVAAAKAAKATAAFRNEDVGAEVTTVRARSNAISSDTNGLTMIN